MNRSTSTGHSRCQCFTATGKGSGVEIEQQVAAIFIERDGKAIRVEGYQTVAEARAAAGLD